MEGTPQLLTDVKFTQLRKGGYDPEEVDNYLERINDAVAKLAENLRDATERAEAAQAQVSDARRAQEEAEAELERIRGGGMASSAPSADEEVAKVLVLAQRAADQAIEEANETATKTVADARAKSVNLLADAEQERERLLAKAHKKADSVAEERARMLNDQVAALSAAKADLETDVAALTTHLELERDRLRENIESVRAALDDPEGLRLAPAPELLDTPVPHVDLPASNDRPSPFAPVEPETAESETAEIDLDAQLAPAADPDEVQAESGIDDGSPAPVDAAEPEVGAEASAEAADPSDPIILDDPESEPDTPAPTDGIEVVPSADDEAPAPPSDDTNTRLFDRDAVVDDELLDTGPPTELFTPEDQPLGPPDKEADEAMRAFFERDLDDPAVPSGRGRFGRRR